MNAPPTDLADLRRDPHQHPEPSFGEERTAGLVADRLATPALHVRTRTGVVGGLADGPGPTVLVRADVDALPVPEETRLPLAGADRGTRDGVDVPVMQARGHDRHVTCLLFVPLIDPPIRVGAGASVGTARECLAVGP